MDTGAPGIGTVLFFWILGGAALFYAVRKTRPAARI